MDQSYTTFDLSEEALNSNGVRVSFNVDFIETNKTVGTQLDISVLPWDVIEIEIELRALANTQNKTKYLFGLVNLATGEFIPCEFSTGEIMIFDYGVNDWFYTSNDNGSLTASFNIDPSVLATATQGFALVIETTWGGGLSTGAAEYYTVGDFKVEMNYGGNSGTLGLGVYIRIFDYWRCGNSQRKINITSKYLNKKTRSFRPVFFVQNDFYGQSDFALGASY